MGIEIPRMACCLGENKTCKVLGNGPLEVSFVFAIAVVRYLIVSLLLRSQTHFFACDRQAAPSSFPAIASYRRLDLKASF
jgi:hypothetical protein